MLSAQEASRRRELQRGAFAHGGTLSQAEAAELGELDARARPQPVAEAAAATPQAEQSEAPPREPQPTPDASPTEPESVAAPQRHRISTRALLVLVVLVGVVIGALAGRVVFADDGAIAMDTTQQQRWAELEASGAYAPGSVKLGGSQYGVDAWLVTNRSTGAECVVLTRGKQESLGCATPGEDDVLNGYGANLSVADPDARYEVWVNVGRDLSGRRVLIAQRQDANVEWNWRSGYTENELAQIDVMSAEGFTGEFLSIVGYDGAEPVWLSQAEQTCVLFERDGTVFSHCGELLADSQPGLSLTVGDTTYTVHTSSHTGHSLSIRRDGGQ